MNAPPKSVTVTWFDLIVMGSLILAAMSIWLLIEKQMRISLTEWEPQASVFQKKYEVPLLDLRLSHLLEQRKSVEGQLIEQESAVARETTTQRTLQNDYPILSRSALTQTFAVPTEIRKQYLTALLNLRTSENLITLLTIEEEKLAAERAAISTTLLTLGPSSVQSTTLTSQVASMAAKQDALEEQLIEAQSHQFEQSALVNALELTYPNLAPNNQVAPVALPPPSILDTYIGSLQTREFAQNSIEMLRPNLQVLETQSADATILLQQAKEAAERDLGLAQSIHSWWVRLLTLVTASLITFILTAIVIFLIALLPHEQPKRDLGLEVGVIFTIVTILYAYEFLQFTAATIVAAVVSLVIVLLIARNKAATSQVSPGSGS
jgi:hypothetical protein